ncbi:hypothetical protein LCGC14_0978580, partial [marine sediment metagenome]
MTYVPEDDFLDKLVEVVHKLSNIVKTQSYRFKTKWDNYLKPLNEKPHIVRQIPLDKEKFLEEIDYRIQVLKTVEQAVVDGFYCIKTLLQTLYQSYFDSELFKKDFSEEDQLILKYLVAKEILGNLIQFNKLDHESVPLKYNIIARNYTLIKMKGQTDIEILDSLKKLNLREIKVSELNKLMKEIKADGIINITKKDKNYFYELNKELELSNEGSQRYNVILRPLIDFPTSFWRSFYNIRELNVTPDKNFKYRDFLLKVLIKSATQGYA